jgi:hypothetical protein
MGLDPLKPTTEPIPYLQGDPKKDTWKPQPFPEGVPEPVIKAFAIIQEWSTFLKKSTFAMHADLEARYRKDKLATEQRAEGAADSPADIDLGKQAKPAEHIPDPPPEPFISVP